MTKPRSVHTEDMQFPIAEDAEVTAEQIYKLVNVPGLPNSCVLWNGHQFEVVSFYLDSSRRSDYWRYSFGTGEATPTFEASMHLYYPLDPRTDKIDWEGANKAYPNETGDAWLPEHCDADYHLDHEVILESVIVGLFQPEVDILRTDVDTKLATLIKRPDDSSAGARELAARVKLHNLLTVRGHLLTCALQEARKRPIGWYHQNPQDSHLHEEILDCLGKAILLNNLTQSAVYLSVDGELKRIANRLKTKHNYERRWELKARLKAEAAAREASAEASSDGGSD